MTDSSELTSIYEQVLGRAPDESGIATYSAMLDDGSAPTTVEAIVANSLEAQKDIEDIYQQALGRDADSSGLASYTNALATGASLAQLWAVIAQSQEAQNNLNQLYQEVLGRNADSGGLATYANLLANGGSLHQIRAILAHSSEAQDGINGIYQQVLGRDADPGGLKTYQDALSTGWTLSGVRSQIAQSQEAQSDVTSTFQRVLNRDPSAAELASAENQLTQGASLANLKQQLASNGALDANTGSLTAPSSTVSVDPLTGVTSDLVGIRLQNTGSSTEPSGYVTFGQVFLPGTVNPGDSLVARVNGVNYALQMDVKSTNADGSVRQAILTLDAPAIAGGGTLDLMLAKGSAAGPSPAAPSASALLASGYNVGVSFTFHNPDGTTTTDSASGAAALQAALNAGTVKSWLSGPGVNEYDVVTTADGGKLKVEFDIRAYANGTTSTDVIFDNSWFFSPGKTDLNYDVAMNQGGQQVYSATGVQQYLYSMWDHQVNSAGTISPNVQYDIPYLMATGAIQTYDSSYGVADSMIQYNAGAPNTPMGTGNMDTHMGDVGPRQDIGTQPNWMTEWLLSQNATAYQVMMTDAAASGGIPWHYTDENSGKPINGQTYPNIFGGTNPVNGGPQYGVNGDPWQIDLAHEPDLSYLPYLVTGSHYQLDLLQAQADYSIIGVWGYGNAFDNTGTVPTGFASSFNSSNTVSNGNQVRAVGWELRQVAEAAYITPDSDPMKAYFVNELNVAMKGLVQEYIVDNTNGQYGQLNGFIEGSSGPNIGTVFPWQQDYVVTSIAEIAGMNIPQASADAVQLLQYMNNFVAGLYTNGANGFNPLDGSFYFANINNPTTGAPYTTWAQFYNNNLSQSVPWSDGYAGLNPSPTTLIGHAAGPAIYGGGTLGGYPEIAKAALADEITFTQSPQAIQAYGFVVSQIAYAYALAGANETQDYRQFSMWSVVPRLPDGVWLQNSQMQIDVSGASTVNLTATGGDSLLAVVGNGTATLTGATGTTDLLFAGTGPTTLKAGTGNDYMFGAYNSSSPTTFVDNTGNNYMMGGGGPNAYLFSESNSGHDTIANFHISADHVQIAPNLNGNGITNASQLIAGATVSNGNTVLHLSPKDDITLLGVSQPSSLINSILVS